MSYDPKGIITHNLRFSLVSCKTAPISYKRPFTSSHSSACSPLISRSFLPKNSNDFGIPMDFHDFHSFCIYFPKGFHTFSTHSPSFFPSGQARWATPGPCPGAAAARPAAGGAARALPGATAAARARSATGRGCWCPGRWWLWCVHNKVDKTMPSTTRLGVGNIPAIYGWWLGDGYYVSLPEGTVAIPQKDRKVNLHYLGIYVSILVGMTPSGFWKVSYIGLPVVPHKAMAEVSE